MLLYFVLSLVVLQAEGGFEDDIKSMLQLIDIPEFLRNNALERGVSANCSRDIYDTAKVLGQVMEQGNVTEDTIWAVRVLDSMPPMMTGGMLTGNLWQLGHFDECLNVTNPNGLFTGQHCVLNLEMDLIDKAMAGTKFEQYHPTFHYGVCIPSTCTIDDVNLMFNNYSTTYLATATEENCWTKDKTWIWDQADWAVVISIAVLVGATILSTIYEGIQIIRKNDKMSPLLTSFSAIKNNRSLFSIRKGGIPAIDGIRVATIMWMLDCHVYLNYAYVPMSNARDNEDDLDSESYVFVWNGVFAPDTFLFISGLMATLMFMRVYSLRKSFDAPVFILHRMMRLTPSLALVVGVSATIFRTFGRGPNWYQGYEYLRNSCKEKWWTTILYVSNYVDPETMCIFPSWFLSVDMQIYWLSPLLLYPVVFWPKLGALLLFALTLGSSLLTFGLDQAKEMFMNVRTGGIPQWTDDYITTHTRATPWLAGACLAIVLSYQMSKKIKVKMSARAAILGWIFSTVCCLGSLLSSFRFLHDRPFTWTETAAYLAFTRLAWGMGMSWIVFACYHGYGGPANWMLSLPMFQPLGKLSYSVFLTHTLVQKVRTGLLRNSYFQTELTQAYFFFGDYAISTVFAYMLYITVEAPFMNLDKVLFGKLQIFPFPPPKQDEGKKLNLETKEKKEMESNGNDNLANIIVENEEQNEKHELKIPLEMTEKPEIISNKEEEKTSL